MRLWSLHPSLLDASGLTACWREGLLARSVLSGATVGYRNHPQLLRFRASVDPLAAIDTYLYGILCEASSRGYRFDGSKIGSADLALQLDVTDGQLAYELEHLKRKLMHRAPQRLVGLNGLVVPPPHLLFRVVVGKIENWEIVK